MADPRGVVWNTRLRWSRSQTDAAPHLNIYLSLSLLSLSLSRYLSLSLSLSLSPLSLSLSSLSLSLSVRLSPPCLYAPKVPQTLLQLSSTQALRNTLCFVNLAGKIARGVLLQWDTVRLFICALHINCLPILRFWKGRYTPKISILFALSCYSKWIYEWLFL